MDLSENRVFFTEMALVHFPALNTYLQTATPSVIKTIDAWQRTLHDVTTEEAIAVLYRWTKDELPRPVYLELPDFALHLRGVVMRDRTQQRHAVILDQIKDRGRGCPDDTRVLGVSFQPFGQWYEVKATSASFAVVPEATQIPVQDEFVGIALIDPHAIS